MEEFSIYTPTHANCTRVEMSESSAGPDRSNEDQVLSVALQLLRPLTRLLIAQGLKYGDAAEILKRAFVESSRAALESSATAVNASRISVGTGLHRQDVRRLLDSPGVAIQRGRSLAGEVYTRWLTDPHYRVKGRPRDLPMRAAAGRPSFETLARAVSTDVHPRTIGEELRRLQLVEFIGADRLRISPSGFVPINERAGMLGLLGDNVGDHFATAVGNVLGDTPRLLEQSLYADDLDDDAIAAVDAKVREIWFQSMDVLVPLLEVLIYQSRRAASASASSGRDPARRRRLRVGMYVHAQSTSPGKTADASPPESFDQDKESS